VSEQHLVVGYKLICEKCGHEQMFDWELFKGIGAELLNQAAELLRSVKISGETPNGWYARRDQWLRDAGFDTTTPQ